MPPVFDTLLRSNPECLHYFFTMVVEETIITVVNVCLCDYAPNVPNRFNLSHGVGYVLGVVTKFQRFPVFG